VRKLWSTASTDAVQARTVVVDRAPTRCSSRHRGAARGSASLLQKIDVRCAVLIEARIVEPTTPQPQPRRAAADPAAIAPVGSSGPTTGAAWGDVGDRAGGTVITTRSARGSARRYGSIPATQLRQLRGGDRVHAAGAALTLFNASLSRFLTLEVSRSRRWRARSSHPA